MGYEAVLIDSYQYFRELAAGTFRAYSILVAYKQKMETSSEMAVSICRVSCSRRCEF
jgi:roadblock/LC7 domain-containing protein